MRVTPCGHGPSRGRTLPAAFGRGRGFLILRPDVVVAGRFTKRATRELLKDKGLRVVEFDAVRSVQEVRDQIAQMGALIGHPERAVKLVERIDAAVERARAAASRTQFRVLAVSRRGWVPGSNSLTTSLLTMIGLANAASELGIRSGGFASLEAIVHLDRTSFWSPTIVRLLTIRGARSCCIRCWRFCIPRPSEL